jgi:threonine/homoserine/homoserine lactone efflux protein
VTFIVAFIVSFIGSIPPGAINLSVLQLGLEHRNDAALRFSMAAALIEIPYAFVAIRFQSLLESSPWLIDNFKLMAAIVLLVLGIMSLRQANGSKPVSALVERIRKSGFRRGLLIGLFNPMAMVFWIGVTAYLKQHDWVDLSSTANELAYIVGLSLGTFTLLACLTYLSKAIAPLFKGNKYLERIPAVAFFLLAVYSAGQYFHFI